MTPSPGTAACEIGLVVDSRQRRNRFGRYAAEILRAEGIRGVRLVELADVVGRERESGDALARFGVVVVTSCGAVPGMADALAAYVERGGRLVLVCPAVELAPLAGLEPRWQAAVGRTLLPDSASPVVAGFPYEPVQIVGPVELHRPAAGTAVLARTVEGHWPVEAHPAITLRTLGRGRVLSFLYDLPHTVARLRQGDPALAAYDTDGLDGVRPNDASQWQIDVRAGSLPQAEVHQALLARAVEWLCPWPLPRVWYLPGAAQALLVLTGDLCSNHPSSDQWLMDEAAFAERHGGRLTYYLHEAATFPPDLAAQLGERGHTLSIHPFARPFSAPSMDETLGRHLAGFERRYGGRPRTVRHHRLQWLGWAEQAAIERRHGLAMDLNFTTNRPLRSGYSFGAGRPLRFAGDDGAVIDTWQQPTLFEDDLVLGTHEISLRIETAEACRLYDEVLDGALRRWHTVVAINLHPGNFARYSGDWGRHVIATTAAQGVPIWNADRWLDFTLSRDSLDWGIRRTGDGAWEVDVPRGTGADDLVLLLPEDCVAGSLASAPAGTAGTGAGAGYTIYGKRYRGLALAGAPARIEVTYAAGAVQAEPPESSVTR